MAYELSNPVRRVSPQNSNGPVLWTYADGDSLATIDGSGYFNLDAGKLQVGDWIFVSSATTYGIFIVNGNTRDLLASPAVLGVVDTTNAVAVGTADSD